MATNPLNRRPSTNTGQIRSAPTGGEENDAKPANGIPIESPELFPVCVRRQIGVEQSDQPEDCDHPAVGTILAHSGAQISGAEERDAGQHKEYDRKRNQGRVGEEGSKASPTEDGKAEIGKGRYRGDEAQSRCKRHGRLA
jgi:hypothetical protein